MGSTKFGFVTKISIFASMISLFLFVAYWTWESYDNFFGYVFNSNPNAVRYVSRLGLVFWAGHIGLTLRLVGIFLGLLTLILLWSNIKHSIKVRWLVASALLLEGLYFLLYFPFVPYLWRPNTYFLSIAYLLQIILTTPFLLFLAIKIRNYQNELDNRSFWRWAGLTFMGYVSGLWVNALFRWFDMGRIEGLPFLFTGIIPIGFLNGVIVMSLALAFSIAAARSMATPNQAKSRRWIGLALTMLGLHYVFYVFYSYIAGIMNFILLVDVWAIPLLALGVSLLFDKTATLQLGNPFPQRVTRVKSFN